MMKPVLNYTPTTPEQRRASQEAGARTLFILLALRRRDWRSLANLLKGANTTAANTTQE